MLRLGLPENHREMVSKCKVPIATVLIMNKHGSFSSFLIDMKRGVQKLFKVILQLCMYVFFYFCIFFWGKGPGISSELIRFMTKGSLRATNLFSDQMHLWWGRNSQYGFQTHCVSRAIIYKGLWLLVSDSPKYQGVRKEFLNSLYVLSSKPKNFVWKGFLFCFVSLFKG